MESDKIKWDLRHKEHSSRGAPLELLQKNIHRANVGLALDIACGLGRNSLFMRDYGFNVDSIDISSYAIESLSKERNICAQCVDLDNFKIPKRHYDLICKSYFLERRLFPYMIEGLKKNGILIAETFVESCVESQNAPVSDSSYLLRKNELLYAFLKLEILFYEEALIEQTKDKKDILVARLVARA